MPSRKTNLATGSASRSILQEFTDRCRQRPYLRNDTHTQRFAACLLGESPVGDQRRALRRQNERARLTGKAGEVIPARRMGNNQRAEARFVELFSKRATALREWSRHKRIEETVVSSI
jgi:hypothetical protein